MSDGKRYLLAGAFTAVILGFISVGVGLKERRLASSASQVPEEISLKDLIARGQAGNPNIILKDFVLCENFVYKTRGTMWTSVWVPVVPRESVPTGQGGKPAAVQALLFSINVSNAEELNQRCGQPRLPALVTNGMVSLGGQEETLLKQTYPDTDFSRCLIIQEGRKPASGLKQLLMIGGGGLIGLIGLGICGFMGVQWYRDRPATRRKRRRRDKEDDRPLRKRPIRDEEEEKPVRRARKSRRDD